MTNNISDKLNNRIKNLEDKVRTLERLLLSTDKSEVISTILENTDSIDADYIDSGTVAVARIHTDIARENELVDTTLIADAPTGGKNGDMWKNATNGNIYLKIAGSWEQIA